MAICCARSIAKLIADAEAPVAVSLFSTPGLPKIDAKAAAVDAWMRDIAKEAGDKLEYRWIAVTDEATRTLAKLYGAELYALCCLEYPTDISLHRLPRAQEAIAKYHREVRAQARGELETLTAGDEDWKLLLGEDWVARLAPRVIEDKKIDLVVMGGVSKPRLAGALLGTTAQRLLDKVSVSTWMVRPERQGPPAHRED